MLELSTNQEAEAQKVSDFIRIVKTTVESNLSSVWIIGEVANFTRAASGHWYFVLRDDKAQVDCVMLARDNRKAEITPSTGDKVTIYAAPTLYAPRGRFQLMVSALRPDGVGRLHQLFLERKKAWYALGWFDKATPPPLLPRRVGVVCSLAGAAVRDVLRTLCLRLPSVSVVLYPALAQGHDAAEKIGAAIITAGQRAECDVLLVCRGGGGIEDLWAYNEEAVVTAIVQCPIPVITGIGHEVDETLADYAADLRTATPTAAASAAVPNAAALTQKLDENAIRLYRRLQSGVEDRTQRLDWAIRFFAVPEGMLRGKVAKWQQIKADLLHSADKLFNRLQKRLSARAYHLRLPDDALLQRRLTDNARRLQYNMSTYFKTAEAALVGCEKSLVLLSPQNAMQRGYSIVYDNHKTVVTNAANLKPEAEVTILFHQGEVGAVVKKTPSSGTLL